MKDLDICDDTINHRTTLSLVDRNDLVYIYAVDEEDKSITEWFGDKKMVRKVRDYLTKWLKTQR